MLRSISIFAWFFIVSAPIVSNAYDKGFIVPIVEKASRSVVFVATESNPLSYQGQSSGYTCSKLFNEYSWSTRYSHGSGVIISPDGHIVTSAHVVRDATRVMIVMRTTESRVFRASVLGKDHRTDLAVLKIEDDIDGPLPVLCFGDSNQTQVGEPVICIGNPLSFQLELSVTTGIVSGIDRNNFRYLPIEGYIQTDAVINEGNSGSPLLNAAGEVIGIVGWGFNHSLGYEGLSFAIPSHIVSHVAKQIMKHGKISQGFLGVKLGDDIETAFDIYQFNRCEGAYIIAIIKNSPAEKAGLKRGDLVLKVDHRPIRSSKSLRNQIAILEPKTKVLLLINRDGHTFEAAVELGNEELSKTYSNLEGPIII